MPKKTKEPKIFARRQMTLNCTPQEYLAWLQDYLKKNAPNMEAVAEGDFASGHGTINIYRKGD